MNLKKREKEVFRPLFLLGLAEGFEECGHRKFIKRFCEEYPDIVDSMFEKCLDTAWEIRPSERVEKMREISRERAKKFIKDVYAIYS